MMLPTWRAFSPDGRLAILPMPHRSPAGSSLPLRATNPETGRCWASAIRTADKSVGVGRASRSGGAQGHGAPHRSEACAALRIGRPTRQPRPAPRGCVPQDRRRPGGRVQDARGDRRRPGAFSLSKCYRPTISSWPSCAASRSNPSRRKCFASPISSASRCGGRRRRQAGPTRTRRGRPPPLYASVCALRRSSPSA